MVIDWTTELAEIDDLTVRHYCEKAHESLVAGIRLGLDDHPKAELIWQTACEMFADDVARADHN